MGLVKLDDSFHILSDIIGDEDALGDMDFKVAGTTEGITALQMDIKVGGISYDIMKHALSQAKEGRAYILETMGGSLSSHREKLNKNAPQITKIPLPKNKIGEVIGPGGKNIKEICEVTGATVDINDEGVAFVAAADQEKSDKAIAMIRGIIEEPEVGKVYEGSIKSLLDFGAIVRFMGKREGLVHISEMREEKVEKVTDVVKEGDAVQVKVLEVDPRRGRIRLTFLLDKQKKKGDSKKEHKSSSSNKTKQDKKPSKHKESETREASTKKYFNA